VKIQTELPLKEFSSNTTVFDVVRMDKVDRMNDTSMLVINPSDGVDKTKMDAHPVMHHQRVDRVGQMSFYTFSDRKPKVLLEGKEGEWDIGNYLQRNGYG